MLREGSLPQAAFPGVGHTWWPSLCWVCSVHLCPAKEQGIKKEKPQSWTECTWETPTGSDSCCCLVGTGAPGALCSLGVTQGGLGDGRVSLWRLLKVPFRFSKEPIQSSERGVSLPLAPRQMQLKTIKRRKRI